MTPKEHEFDPVSGRCDGCGLTRGEVATTGKACTAYAPDWKPLPEPVASALEKILAVRDGMDTPAVFHVNQPPADLPGVVMPDVKSVAFGPFELVGMDFDGKVKPIAELEYPSPQSWESDPKASPIEDVRAAQAIFREHSRSIDSTPPADRMGAKIPTSNMADLIHEKIDRLYEDARDKLKQCPHLRYIPVNDSTGRRVGRVTRVGQTPRGDVLVSIEVERSPSGGIADAIRDARLPQVKFSELFPTQPTADHAATGPDRQALVRFAGELMDALIVRLCLSARGAEVVRETVWKHLAKYFS